MVQGVISFNSFQMVCTEPDSETPLKDAVSSKHPTLPYVFLTAEMDSEVGWALHASEQPSM